MKAKPSIDHAINARLNLAGVKKTSHAHSQLAAYLCETLKVADALKALTHAQVYEICKPPAKKEEA